MTSLPQLISARLEAAAQADPELRPATKREFGHYQSSVALRLAKAEGVAPRAVAQRIVDAADLADLCEPLEIAGPGFINIRLRTEVLARAATELVVDPFVGIAQATEPRRIVLDYSSPNVAKQMHVGHLRSTVIGDCFHRVLSAQGHTVIPQNHIGDWGTQFGMLVEQILAEGIDAHALSLAGAEELYARAKRHFDADPVFADLSRQRVVLLQAGEPTTRLIWQTLIDVSLAGFDETYRRMDILLTDSDVAGESTYNAELPGIAAELAARGIAVEDAGALCVFVDGYAAPMIIRKSDGGYGYDASDLATIRHWVTDLRGDRIIYVTDVRQAEHFARIFATARRAGWVPDRVSTEHVGFGMVLGTDGKPFKTREGTAVHLSYLLDEAEKVAAPKIALGAIKYADLSNSLVKDYVFDLDRMTAATGNTGPYLQYAHARIASVFRNPKAAGVPADVVAELPDPAEQELAFLLSGFGEVVAEVGAGLQPHKLCGYLFELATAFSVFYERCPILSVEAAETRSSRLALARATRLVLARGLSLLGIPAPDVM